MENQDTRYILKQIHNRRFIKMNDQIPELINKLEQRTRRDDLSLMYQTSKPVQLMFQLLEVALDYIDAKTNYEEIKVRPNITDLYYATENKLLAAIAKDQNPEPSFDDSIFGFSVVKDAGLGSTSWFTKIQPDEKWKDDNEPPRFRYIVNSRAEGKSHLSIFNPAEGAPVESKMLMNEDDVNHLEWIYNRMVNLLKQDPKCDYMIKFKQIIYSLR